MLEVQVKSKKTKLRVTNEDGEELGILSFYPTDYELPIRAEKSEIRIHALLEKVKGEDIAAMSEDEFLAAMHDVNEEIKKELNYIFDTDITQLFGNTSMLTPTTDGTFLIENIFDGVIPAVISEIKKVSEKAKENTSRYLEKYKK